MSPTNPEFRIPHVMQIFWSCGQTTPNEIEIQPKKPKTKFDKTLT